MKTKNKLIAILNRAFGLILKALVDKGYSLIWVEIPANRWFNLKKLGFQVDRDRKVQGTFLLPPPL